MNPKNIPKSYSPGQLMIESFGKDQPNVIIVDGDMRIENLYIPKSLTTLKGSIDSHQNIYYNNLKEIALKSKKDNYPKRIYLSRKLFLRQRRVFHNENKIEELFKNNGFEIIYPEKLDYKSQICYYHHAEIMAGLSGSALHNTVYQQVNSKCISIGNEREPFYPHVNQIMCCNLSGTKSEHITLNLDYNPKNKSEKIFNIEHAKNELARILNNKKSTSIQNEHDASSNETYCILGMHRGGTSSLAGSFQLAGISGGRVSTQSPYQPAGNRENIHILKLNNQILKDNGGSWNEPPKNIQYSDEHIRIRDQIVNEMNIQSNVWMFKEPRTLLTFEFWESALSNIRLIGSLRHPLSTAVSLYKRSGMEFIKGLKLWIHYNKKLNALHEKYNFTILSFDNNPQSYLDNLRNYFQENGITESNGYDLKKALGFYNTKYKTNTLYKAIISKEDYHNVIVNEALSLYEELLNKTNSKKHLKNQVIAYIPLIQTETSWKEAYELSEDKSLAVSALLQIYIKAKKWDLAIGMLKDNALSEKIKVSFAIQILKGKDDIEELSSQIIENVPFAETNDLLSVAAYYNKKNLREKSYDLIQLIINNDKVNEWREHLRVGTILLFLQKNDDAIQHLNSALSLYPFHIKTYQVLAKAYLKNNEIDKCIDTCNQVIDLAPNTPDSTILLLISKAYFTKNDFDIALTHVQQSIELNDSDEGAHLLHIKILKKLRRKREAIRIATNAIGKFPDNKPIRKLYQSLT